MKTIIFAIIAINSISAFASTSVVTCRIDYEQNGNKYREMSYHEVSKFTVSNCIKKALNAKERSTESVPFTFTHYTRITRTENAPVNVDVNSQGFKLSSEVTENGVIPTNLKYEEFVNP